MSWLRHFWCFGLVTLIESSTSSLTAQAPGPGALGSPDLPRFTVREIIAGHNDTLARIPGRGLKAARTVVPDSLAFQAYQDAASRGGLAPLPSDILDAERSRQVLGLHEHAARPSHLMTSPALRRAWRRFAPAAESVVTVPAQRVLIPEVTFTVEDGFPDVITSRILLPPSPRRVH